jgi:superfamily II DNA or RNA helicase
MLYKRKEIVHSAGERQDCATALARLLPLGSRTIFFLERIEAADALYERLSEFLGGRVRRYHSALSREVKRRSLAAYREGEACALVCCHALDEGLDIPDTDTGVIVSATGAARQRIQRLGRLLRRGERKNVYYIYVVDSAEDAVLLPELPAGEELFFFERTGRFTNRPYDALVARWRQRLPRRGLTPEQTAEVERHLRRGAIRDDYRLSGALCLERALAAEGSERNYWITMKMLADEGDIPEVVW